MPTLWNSLLYFLSEITRENCTTLICCPLCGNSDSYVKCGFYSRYLFDNELIKIQRYRCDNALCRAWSYLRPLTVKRLISVGCVAAPDSPHYSREIQRGRLV